MIGHSRSDRSTLSWLKHWEIALFVRQFTVLILRTLHNLWIRFVINLPLQLFHAYLMHSSVLGRHLSCNNYRVYYHCWFLSLLQLQTTVHDLDRSIDCSYHLIFCIFYVVLVRIWNTFCQLSILHYSSMVLNWIHHTICPFLF